MGGSGPARALLIPELDELNPPRWLDGDELHPAAQIDSEQWTGFYAPNGTPIPGDDPTEQAKGFDRHRSEPGAINHTVIRLEGGDEILVSTAYLGIDMCWGQAGAPIIWETMIRYGDWQDQYQWRYATRNAAMDNHRRVVEIICRHTGAHAKEIKP